MSEQPPPATSFPLEPAQLAQAEELFLSLAQSGEGAYYLGRWHDLAPEELRALFGLAIAGLRQARRGDAPARHHAPARPPHAPASVDAAPLEDRLQAMMAALAQRDERIRELQRALKKTSKGN